MDPRYLTDDVLQCDLCGARSPYVLWHLPRKTMFILWSNPKIKKVLPFKSWNLLLDARNFSPKYVHYTVNNVTLQYANYMCHQIYIKHVES